MRILAVEDEPEYLEMLKLVMKSVGHSVIVASNGLEALKLLEGEKIDVILSDVKMPTMGGVEFHQKLRAKPEYANIPFIFLTAVSDLNAVKAVCEPGRDLLLSKPFPVDQLLKLFSGALKE
jgi:two-component system chemotaxis response regulator CheY